MSELGDVREVLEGDTDGQESPERTARYLDGDQTVIADGGQVEEEEEESEEDGYLAGTAEGLREGSVTAGLALGGIGALAAGGYLLQRGSRGSWASAAAGTPLAVYGAGASVLAMSRITNAPEHIQNAREWAEGLTDEIDEADGGGGIDDHYDVEADYGLEDVYENLSFLFEPPSNEGDGNMFDEEGDVSYSDTRAASGISRLLGDFGDTINDYVGRVADWYLGGD